jgi:ribosome-associated toxin RatA of RatAB toxin-antitoxin module
MFAVLTALLLLVLTLPLPGRADNSTLTVDVQRAEQSGRAQFDITASGSVNAPPALVWKVLTGYERMPEFVPDMISNRVVSRQGNRLLLEQQGRARFLFFRRDIKVKVEVVEEPSSAIDVNLISGDMEAYRCRWELLPQPDGSTRIHYRGSVVPKFYVPAMLGVPLIRSDVRTMLKSVFQHIEREAEAARSPTAPQAAAPVPQTNPQSP